MKFKVLSKMEIDPSFFTFKMVQHFLKLHCTASNEIKMKYTTDQEKGVSIQSGSLRADEVVLKKRPSTNMGIGHVSVCGGAAVPEAGSEVVAAGHEAGIGGRVDNASDDVVVSQRQQVFPLGCARVPAAKADCALVGQQHVVLCVVEHTLRTMHLTAAQPRPCNTQKEHVTRRVHCTKKLMHVNLSFLIKKPFLVVFKPFRMIMVADLQSKFLVVLVGLLDSDT